MSLTLATLIPGLLFIILGVPLLIGYSRIYTGAHWPSDVLISWILGIGVGLLTAVLAGWLWQRFARRCCPSLRDNHPTLFAT